MNGFQTSKNYSGKSRLKPNAWRAFIWLLVFGACGVYGYFGPGSSAARGGGGSFDSHEAFEVTICFLAFGVGLATCVVAGIAAVTRLRTTRISEVLAALFIWTICGGPALSALVLIICRAIKTLDFLQEEEALFAVAGVVGLAMEAAAASLLVFIAIILSIKAKPASPVKLA